MWLAFSIEGDNHAWIREEIRRRRRALQRAAERNQHLPRARRIGVVAAGALFEAVDQCFEREWNIVGRSAIAFGTGVANTVASIDVSSPADSRTAFTSFAKAGCPDP